MTDAVILVAGGGGGIGRATCAKLAQRGARVAVADLAREQAESVAAEISARGGHAVAVTCDITDASDCERAAATAAEQFGTLTGMVNCAGVSKPWDSFALPPAEWTRMVDVQLNGAFFLAQACGKHMRQNGGSIVFITSTNAEAAFPRRAA